MRSHTEIGTPKADRAFARPECSPELLPLHVRMHEQARDDVAGLKVLATIDDKLRARQLLAA